jgi:hypothetical protein
MHHAIMLVYDVIDAPCIVLVYDGIDAPCIVMSVHLEPQLTGEALMAAPLSLGAGAARIPWSRSPVVMAPASPTARECAASCEEGNAASHWAVAPSAPTQRPHDDTWSEHPASFIHTYTRLPQRRRV